MRIYLNSEKLFVDTTQLTVEEVLQCAGFLVSHKYYVVDELTHHKFYIGDVISLRCNMSLMVVESKEMVRWIKQ